ncbi:uncharacterized protein LOC108852003 isoform X2 [Raphanus sativus]|uniref:Uncharacterized protein LOC108852003 isoform X2 n=1 Tax=Raphanus sativus TaxID=3726 RepID=A0A6J0N8F9_RAPSA|nr:uncharacterized protein LOC108852003 isoform X2 [Raphanus sativus]
MTMQCIKTRSPNQLAQATVAIQGFIHALLLIFSEAVPALRLATGDKTDSESGEEEDISVVSFKLDKIWELDAEEGVEVLPIIPLADVEVGDCSWTDEAGFKALLLLWCLLLEWLRKRNAKLMFGLLRILLRRPSPKNQSSVVNTVGQVAMGSMGR